MVQIFGAVGEWILGNTFSSALFFTYGMQIEPFLTRERQKRKIINKSDAGTFWIVQGTTQIPWYGVGTNYSTTGNTLEGMQTPEFAATTGSFTSYFPFHHDQCLTNYPGLYYAVLAILTFVYLICSIRTNVCLFLALFLLVITFALTAATFFQSSVGNLAHAATLQKVSISKDIPVYE